MKSRINAIQNLQINLSLLRTAYRYTVKEMASACGVSLPTMRQYITDPSRMSVQQICGLAGLTRLPPETLLGGLLSGERRVI